MRKNTIDFNSHHSRTLLRLKDSKIPRREWTQALYDKFYEDAQLAADGYRNNRWLVTVKEDEKDSWEFYNGLPAE